MHTYADTSKGPKWEMRGWGELPTVAAGDWQAYLRAAPRLRITGVETCFWLRVNRRWICSRVASLKCQVQSHALRCCVCTGVKKLSSRSLYSKWWIEALIIAFSFKTFVADETAFVFILRGKLQPETIWKRKAGYFDDLESIKIVFSCRI